MLRAQCGGAAAAYLSEKTGFGLLELVGFVYPGEVIGDREAGSRYEQ